MLKIPRRAARDRAVKRGSLSSDASHSSISQARLFSVAGVLKISRGGSANCLLDGQPHQICRIDLNRLREGRHPIKRGFVATVHEEGQHIRIGKA